MPKETQYYRRKRAGQCVLCGASDERTRAGRIYCTACGEAFNSRFRKTDGRVRNRLCVICGRPLDPNLKGRRCPGCEDKSPDEVKGLSLYERRKRFGLCVKCGLEDDRTRAGKTVCAACADTLEGRRQNRLEQDPDRPGELQKARYYQRVQNRLCTKCGKPLDQGWPYQLCPECREQNRLSSLKSHRKRRAEEKAQKRMDTHGPELNTYERRKREGVCTICGRPDDRTRAGGALCASCLESVNTKCAASRRATYQMRIREHLCTHCGAPLEPGRTTQMCPACTEETGQKQKERYQKRIRGHLCTKCGEALDPAWPYQLCPACRERANELCRESARRRRSADRA